MLACVATHGGTSGLRANLQTCLETLTSAVSRTRMSSSVSGQHRTEDKHDSHHLSSTCACNFFIKCCATSSA